MSSSGRLHKIDPDHEQIVKMRRNSVSSPTSSERVESHAAISRAILRSDSESEEDTTLA